MTWTDLLRNEITHLYAHEENIEPILRRLQERAYRAPTHELLLQLHETIPGRQARLEVICALHDWPVRPEAPPILEGWEAEMEHIMDDQPPSVVLDAEILILARKPLRMRTTNYESALLLAEKLGADTIVKLLAPILAEGHEADERILAVLASLVESRGEDWDESLRRSQRE